jgi:TonB family protein
MKRLHIVALLVVSACAIADVHGTTTPEQELATSIGKVDLHAGVTSMQANAIARFYYQHDISGCGGVDPAVDLGSRWEVTPRMGIAGIPSKDPIVIEKHTGQISRRGDSTITLADLTKPKGKLPQPIRISTVRWPMRLPPGAHSTTVKVEFVVLPSGRTSFVSFQNSSGHLECDAAVRKAIDRWRYAPRQAPLGLVESLNTCTY